MLGFGGRKRQSGGIATAVRESVTQAAEAQRAEAFTASVLSRAA